MAELTVLEKAYLAGFFDGDGCVFISSRDDGVLTMQVNISQKDPSIL